MKDKKAYLFSFKFWHDSPPKYILVYAENEQSAREIGAEQYTYNSNAKASPDALILCTFGI